MAKAREEAAKASDAQATNTASAIELAEMAGAAHASAMGEVRSHRILIQSTSDPSVAVLL